MFNMFPYLNLHKINLDYIIKTVNQAVSTVQQSVERIEAALGTVNGLAGRVVALEASTQQLSASVEDMDERLNSSYRRIGALETNVEDLDERLNSSYRRIGALETNVAEKVNNGNSTITGAEHQLTVEGENSGDMTTMTGTAFLAQSLFAGSVPVGWTAERTSSTDDTHIRVFQRGTGTAVRISNLAPGTGDTDAVNVGQIAPVTITGDANNERWTGPSWGVIRNAFINGKPVIVTDETWATADPSSTIIIRMNGMVVQTPTEYLYSIINDPTDSTTQYEYRIYSSGRISLISP